MREAAKISGLSRSQISRIENGILGTVNNDSLLALSLAYHAEVEMTIEPIDRALGHLSDDERLLVMTFREMDETCREIVRQVLKYVDREINK